MTEPLPQDGIELAEIVRRIWAQKYLVAAVTTIGTGIALVYAMLAIPFYESTTKLVFQSTTKSTAGGLSALAAMAGMASAADGDASAYAGDIVLSNDMLGAILDHKWKASKAVPDTSKELNLLELWKVKSDTTQPDWKAAQRQSLLQSLRAGGYIQYSADKKTGVVTLQTTFEDPLVAYEVNRFLFDELNNTLVNRMNYKARANRQFVEGRLKEIDTDLNTSENILKNFRENNRLRLDPGYQLQESRLQRKVEMNQEIFLQLQKQFEMARIDEAKDIPVLDVIDSPMVPVRKVRPKRAKMVFTGTVASVAIGVCLAFLLSTFRMRKKHPASNT